MCSRPLDQLSQGPKFFLDCLQPFCQDLITAYLENHQRVIIHGLYQSRKFVGDVSYLEISGPWTSLWAGSGWRIGPYIPLRRGLLPFFIFEEAVMQRVDCPALGDSSIPEEPSSTSSFPCFSYSRVSEDQDINRLNIYS